jgi:cell pole-organizing protein PopZ
MVQHMKPIIREWMDQKLPPLIEKAVKAEIAAAVRSLMQRR